MVGNTQKSMDDSIQGTWDSTQTHHTLKFIRLRLVRVDCEGFVTCSFEFPSRWLLPCSHICNVLDRSEYFIPDLMHLRWWKHFNYLYKNESSKRSGLSHNQLIKTLDEVRSNHFCSRTGKYKGVPLQNNKFMNDVANKEYCFDSQKSRLYYYEMMAIRKLNNIECITLIRGSSIYKKYINNPKNTSSATDEECNTQLSDLEKVKSMVNGNDSNLQSMGGGSQVEISLSQNRTDMTICDSSRDDDEHYENNQSTSMSSFKHTNAYNRLYPLFCEVVGNIKNEKEMNESINTLERLEFSLKANGNNKRVIKPNETTFLGEKNGHRCIEKRHKTRNEK